MKIHHWFICAFEKLVAYFKFLRNNLHMYATVMRLVKLK